MHTGICLKALQFGQNVFRINFFCSKRSESIQAREKQIDMHMHVSAFAHYELAMLLLQCNIDVNRFRIVKVKEI